MTLDTKAAEVERAIILNAFDFLLHGIEHFSGTCQRDNKYVILDLARGVELLLKWRLAKINWAFLFKDVDKADFSKFISGDFKSVGMDEAQERLKRIAGLDNIPKEQMKTLKKLKEERNKIEHFSGEIENKDTIPLLVDTWVLVTELCRSFQEIEDRTWMFDRVDNLVRKLANSEIYCSEMNRRLADRMKDVLGSNTVVRCPICRQPAFPIKHCPPKSLPLAAGRSVTHQELRCLFCLRWFGSDEPLLLWAENIQDYKDCNWNDAGPHSAGPCRNCEESLENIFVEDPEPRYPDAASICFSCGYVESRNNAL